MKHIGIQEHVAYPIINVNSFNIKIDSLREMTLNNHDDASP